MHLFDLGSQWNIIGLDCMSLFWTQIDYPIFLEFAETQKFVVNNIFLMNIVWTLGFVCAVFFFLQKTRVCFS